MLDGGSTKVVISQKLVKRLGLIMTSKRTLLHTVEGTSQRDRFYTRFTIKNMTGDLVLPINDALVTDQLTMDGDKPPKNIEVQGHAYLVGVTFEELPDDSVDVVLSAEFGYTWMGGEVRRSTPDRAIALHTPFGWALLGGRKTSKDETDSCWKTTVTTDDNGIWEMINRLFNHDFPSIDINKKHLSLDDEHALQQLRDTVTFDADKGHYICGLPWKASREHAAKVFSRIDSAGHARDRLIKATKRIKSGRTQMT